MNFTFRNIFRLMISFGIFSCVIVSQVSLAANHSKQVLKVACGNTLAPWVMPEKNKGILLDILHDAMQPLGYEIEAYYFPYARRIMSYQTHVVDVVCDINQKNITNSNLKGAFSGIVYAYKNYAYTLKKHNFHFTKINQLIGHSVLSWQGAKSQLGSEYREMAEKNPFYRETFDQKSQVKMLLLGRVEVIQLDHQIFEYYFKALIEEGLVVIDINDIERFPLFGENPNGFLFSHSKTKNDFVKQLKKMKADGRYADIFQRYMLVKP